MNKVIIDSSTPIQREVTKKYGSTTSICVSLNSKKPFPRFLDSRNLPHAHHNSWTTCDLFTSHSFSLLKNSDMPCEAVAFIAQVQ